MKRYKQYVRKHKHLHFYSDQTGKKGLAGQRVSHILFYFCFWSIRKLGKISTLLYMDLPTLLLASLFTVQTGI